MTVAAAARTAEVAPWKMGRRRGRQGDAHHNRGVTRMARVAPWKGRGGVPNKVGASKEAGMAPIMAGKASTMV